MVFLIGSILDKWKLRLVILCIVKIHGFSFVVLCESVPKKAENEQHTTFLC